MKSIKRKQKTGSQKSFLGVFYSKKKLKRPLYGEGKGLIIRSVVINKGYEFPFSERKGYGFGLCTGRGFGLMVYTILERELL